MTLKLKLMPRSVLKGKIGARLPASISVLPPLTLAQNGLAYTLGASLFTSLLSGIVPASGGGTANFLRADGTWAAPPGGGGGVTDGDKGDIVVSGGGTVWTIDSNVVTYAKMQDVSATSRFIGRITAGAGDPEELTGTQATSLLNVFTAGLKGLAPSSPGGTTAFLRADGTWAAPPGGGGGLPAADGSAAAPSIAFAADLGTGLYRPAASTIGFASQGLQAMTLSVASVGPPPVSLITFPGFALIQALGTGTPDLQIQVTDDIILQPNSGPNNDGTGKVEINNGLANLFSAVTGTQLSNSINDPLLPTRSAEAHDVGTGANNVRFPLRLSSLLPNGSGTAPLVGIGAGLEFQLQTGLWALGAAAYKVGGYVKLVANNVGAGTEGFDLIFGVGGGGAAASDRIKLASNGLFTPATDGIMQLGGPGIAWAGLYLITSSVVDFGNANIQLKHTVNVGLSVSSTGLAADTLLTLNANNGTTVAPPVNSLLHLVGADGFSGDITLDTFATPPAINLRTAAGTRAAKTAVGVNTVIGAIRGYGFDGTAYLSGGNFQFIADETWDGTHHGAAWRLFTFTTGGVITERIRVGMDGGWQLPEIATPSTPGADLLKYYAKDVSGVTHMFALNSTGVEFDLMWQRERLSAARTYFVRDNGNNANNGLANTAGGAFATIQKALDVIVQTLDLGGQTVTIQVTGNAPPGTFGPAVLSQGWVGGGAVIINGDTVTPANVIISANNTHCFLINANMPGPLTIQGFLLTNITSGDGIRMAGIGTVNVGNMRLGPLVGSAFRATGAAATMLLIGDYAVIGNMQAFASIQAGGYMECIGRTITITAAMTMGTAWAFCSNVAAFPSGACTFVNPGNVTGTKFNVNQNAVIDTFGGGVGYFPGTVAGTFPPLTGGQYV